MKRVMDFISKSVRWVFAFLSIVVLHSCTIVQDPDMWQVEIADSYKFQMAEAVVYAAFMAFGLEDEVDESVIMIEKYAITIEEEKTEALESDVAKYKLALEKLCNQDEVCHTLWETYHELDGKVRFSGFIKQPNDGNYSVWTAIEKHCNIRVTFKINKLMDWSLELDEDDFHEFILREILDVYIDD